MAKEHKHRDIIIAWADGAVIECRRTYAGRPPDDWVISPSPSWSLEFEYRVKPVVKEYAVWLIDNSSRAININPKEPT